MIRLIYPDLSRYHCNPHKNGGLRRLVLACVVVIVFVYGVQTILISRSAGNLSDASTTDSSRYHSSDDGSSWGNEDHISPEERCKGTGSTNHCEEPYFPYRISIGYGDRAPRICWNKKDIPLHTTKPSAVTVVEVAVSDGIVINEKSFAANSPKNLANLLAQLRSTRNDSYIVMVTWNAIPFSPTLSSHLKSVGTLVNPKFLGQPLQFLVLGQKGLLPGRGISDVQVFNASPPLDQSGCVPALASSLGNEVDHDFVNSNPGYLVSGEFKIGSVLPNCGMPKPCDGEMLPVHLYTGRDHNDPPKLCINGIYVFENKINNGGRGMNIAVIDGFLGTVVRVANYDTWGIDSTMLEVFLEDLQANEIAVIFTHDEATTKLSELSRTLFFELGSSRIHDLKFRAAWYMIGQKGIRGFTEFEKLHIGEKTNWAEVIDEKICVPRRLKGYLSRPDPLPETRNLQRLAFCSKYKGYGDFCVNERSLSPLTPAKLADVTLVNSPIYSDFTAILVAAGKSRNALRMVLETLLGQPGVNPRQVRVESPHYNDTEIRDLINLFNFQFVFSPRLKLDYNKFLRRATQDTLDYYKSRYIIVIEEHTVLSPDFLHYMASMEPLFELDVSISAIGAWNDNGYNGTSGDLTRIYRVEGFPHQGFLTTRAFWEANAGGRNNHCCNEHSWEGWFEDRAVITVVPDVSRVARIPAMLPGGMFAQEMFARPRVISRQSEKRIDNNFPGSKEKYDAFLTSSISGGISFYAKNYNVCEEAREACVTAPKERAVIIIIERNEEDSGMWYQLCKCFGLFALEEYPPRGRYNDTLSFTFADPQRLVIIVGAQSPFRSATAG